ncbi:MAG TPA: tryptophan--tRNA ligase [bacterium]|nr:tryptophan--tRNA ligase [bacterium]
MRALSGIKPTGTLHIGNYFGAAKQFEMMQEKNYEGYYFIADYHTLNGYPEPAKLTDYTWNVVLDYLAFGLDPQKSVIFLQSQVPEVVELAFILGNYTPMGLLQRAHSYKDKTAKNEQINVGLFYYPLLMSADILLYKSNVVPVGKDQKQHVEIARDIAEKFNLHYQKDVFVLPEPYIPEDVAIVPGTDGQKMSKSYQNTIEMFADDATLKKQIMGILSDSTPLEAPKDPAKCHIYNIFKLFVTKERSNEMAEKLLAGGYGYGHAKKELLEAVHTFFDPMRKKRAELAGNMDFVEKVLKEGSEKARTVAIETIKEVKKVTGLVGNIYN